MIRQVRLTSLPVLCILGLQAVSCGDGKKSPTDTATTSARQAPVTPARRQPIPGDVVRLARQYHFASTLLAPVKHAGTPIDKTGKNKGVPKMQDPGLTFARAEEVQGTTYPSDQEVLLLIHADHSYPGLDIAQGDNYVWRDKKAADPKNWEVWLVHATPPKAVMLKRGTTAYSSGSAKEPRLVREDFTVKNPSAGGQARLDMIAFGVCIDDPVLCNGHCGYSQ